MKTENTITLSPASRANVTRKHKAIDRKAAADKAWVTRRAIEAAEKVAS